MLRLSTVLGATTRNQVTNLFEKPWIFGVRGGDSRFVFIWDRDVAACLERAIDSPVTGVQVLLVCPSAIATNIRDRYRRAGDPTVGTEDAPEAVVAERIHRAARANRRRIATGRVGHLAWWIHRFAPRVYEHFMLRRTRRQR